VITEFEGDHYRAYGDDPDAYVAECRIQPYCDVGIVSMLLGKGILKCLMRDLKYGKLRHFKQLEGYVLPAVYRAIRRKARETTGVYVETCQVCHHNGRDFVWVKIVRDMP
jgi:hypothetical protein